MAAETAHGIAIKAGDRSAACSTNAVSVTAAQPDVLSPLICDDIGYLFYNEVRPKCGVIRACFSLTIAAGQLKGHEGRPGNTTTFMSHSAWHSGFSRCCFLQRPKAMPAGVTIGVVAPQGGNLQQLGAQVFAGANYQITKDGNTVVDNQRALRGKQWCRDRQMRWSTPRCKSQSAFSAAKRWKAHCRSCKDAQHSGDHRLGTRTHPDGRRIEATAGRCFVMAPADGAEAARIYPKRCSTIWEAAADRPYRGRHHPWPRTDRAPSGMRLRTEGHEARLYGHLSPGSGSADRPRRAASKKAGASQGFHRRRPRRRRSHRPRCRS